MAAPTVTTEIEVCNLALARLGQTKQVTSITTPVTPAETIASLHFAATRRNLLRVFLFNFAKKYAQCSRDSTVTPTFGFVRAYTLPADFLKLLGLGDVTINADVEHLSYDIVSGFIYTSNTEDATNKINIYYVFDASTVTTWDAAFLRLMVVQLAHDMAYAFTLKSGLRREIAEELREVRLDATAAAGQEKRPRRIQRSRMIRVRQLGGLRDTTRYPI